MMMNEDRPKGYNIGWEIVGDKCVTTAAVSSSSPYYGYFLNYETIIWNWDGRERTNIIHQIHHRSEAEAIKVHDYIVDNLKEGMESQK